jgi:hypothetical protein
MELAWKPSQIEGASWNSRCCHQDPQIVLGKLRQFISGYDGDPCSTAALGGEPLAGPTRGPRTGAMVDS